MQSTDGLVFLPVWFMCMIRGCFTGEAMHPSVGELHGPVGNLHAIKVLCAHTVFAEHTASGVNNRKCHETHT